MHIDIVPNRNSRPTYLLRESYRDGARVRKRTLANLSALDERQIEAIRCVLRGESLQPASALFDITRSLPYGHVNAVSVAMHQLGFSKLLNARPCRERDLVCAMVAARILAPQTKLATTRWWNTSTLAEDFGVVNADEDDLYAAMDWLLAHQDSIEKKLAARHLGADSLVLYDLSSSYFEGSTCPLAKLGYSRDGKKGTLQVNYGLLTDARGCPVAVSVHEGNTADSVTFMPAVQRCREQFGIERMVMVGDRGMISQKSIDAMQAADGIGWITALKSVSIRALIEGGQLQLGLFDERSLFELSSPDYPGERLVACRNPELAKRRAHKREALLCATEAGLEKIKARVDAAKLVGQDAIGLCVGKAVNRYKVAKHFEITINAGSFTFARKQDCIAAEAALDGIYIIRTSVARTEMDAATCVRNYKALTNVERAFKSLKMTDLKVRPIHHRTAERVRAHIFLCMLAYYVEWHMREAWRELMFADTVLEAKLTRDPVAPAKRSAVALDKARSHTLDDGSPAHSFATLLADLATIVRNTCRTRSDSEPSTSATVPTFDIVTIPTSKQAKALELLKTIAV
jgi:transposase